MSLSKVLSFVVLSAVMAAPAIAQTKPATPAAKGTTKPATAKPAAASKARTVEIIGTDDMKYSVTKIAARPGEQLRIRLTSKGAMPKVVMAHNVVVLQIGTDELKFVTAGMAHRATDFIAPEQKDKVIAMTPLAGTGETVEVVFSVPKKAGTYPFVCTFPGHYQAGMKGVLTVR